MIVSWALIGRESMLSSYSTDVCIFEDISCTGLFCSGLSNMLELTLSSINRVCELRRTFGFNVIRPGPCQRLSQHKWPLMTPETLD